MWYSLLYYIFYVAKCTVSYMYNNITILVHAYVHHMSLAGRCSGPDVSMIQWLPYTACCTIYVFELHACIIYSVYKPFISAGFATCIV